MSDGALQAVLRAAADSMLLEDGETVDVYFRAPDGDTPLHLFAWRGDVESAKVLVEAGADVNATGDMGETPLHVALRKADLPLVRLLLAAGAKVTIRSEFGATAQDLAKRAGGQCAELLSNRRARRRVSHGGA